MSRKARILAKIAAPVVGCAVLVGAGSLVSAGPFSSDGRELPTVDLQAALNVDQAIPGKAPENVQPGNLVAIGDSIFANPKVGDAALNSAASSNPDNQFLQRLVSTDPNINPRGCAQGTPSLPKEMAAQLGVPLNDYSCAAATVYTPRPGNQLMDQVDHAIADGALNPGTKYVAIQGGYNDVYNNYQKLSGENLPDQAIAERLGTTTQKTDFERAIDPIVAKVKEHAPNANIKFVGYHEITEDRPGGWQCLYHIGDGRGQDNKWDISYAFPVYWDTQGKINSNKWMQEAAQRHGVGYIDTRTFSKGHGECASPQDRWVGGVLLDNTTGDFNLSLHLTDQGVNAIGGFAANEFRK